MVGLNLLKILKINKLFIKVVLDKNIISTLSKLQIGRPLLKFSLSFLGSTESTLKKGCSSLNDVSVFMVKREVLVILSLLFGDIISYLESSKWFIRTEKGVNKSSELEFIGGIKTHRSLK